MTLYRAILFASLTAWPAFAADTTTDGPPNARTGACYVQYQAPAIIETVTEQVLVRRAKRGIDPQTGKPTDIVPAIYKTQTVQKIVKPRRQDWAEVICADKYNTEFLQSLQRALTARRYYRGAITGQYDERTKRAVRAYQKKHDINSDQITVDMAEYFGLITHRSFPN